MQVIVGTAKLHGCNASVRWSDVAYIPTVNSPPLVSLVEAAAGRLGATASGAARWRRQLEPTMAAEDFGFLAGALGWRSPPQTSAHLHALLAAVASMQSSGVGVLVDLCPVSASGHVLNAGKGCCVPGQMPSLACSPSWASATRAPAPCTACTRRCSAWMSRSCL